MADLTVGVSNIGKPSPSWMKNIFKGLLYVSGLWAVLGPTCTNIDQHILDSINAWILRGLAIMRFTISFFHYDDIDEIQS